MNASINNKLIHFNLNLNYPLNYMSVDNQTNFIINKIMNNFIINFQNNFKNKIFVYEYNDDLISLIGYKILMNIQGIKPELKIVLYGKKRKTKKYLAPKQKFYSSFRINKEKDNIIFISSFNPIYKVVDIEKKSKKILAPAYYLINEMTPADFFKAQIFYHIGYIPDKKISENNQKIFNFKEWINNPIDTPAQQLLDNIKMPSKILFVWIEEDGKEENNIKILQEIEQTDAMVFYYFKNEMPLILKDPNYNNLILKTSNRPEESYYNLNNYSIPIKILKENKISYDFLGKWSIEDKINITGLIINKGGK